MRWEHWERVNPASGQQQWSLVGVACGVVTPALVLLTAFTGGGLVISAFFVAGGLISVRAYRAGIYTSVERVRIRTVWRTRTFAWSEVASIVTVSQGGGALWGPFRSDVINLMLHGRGLVASTVRVRRPVDGRKANGPLYERAEVVRFLAILQDRLLRSRDRD